MATVLLRFFPLGSLFFVWPSATVSSNAKLYAFLFYLSLGRWKTNREGTKSKFNDEIHSYNEVCGDILATRSALVGPSLTNFQGCFTFPPVFAKEIQVLFSEGLESSAPNEPKLFHVGEETQTKRKKNKQKETEPFIAAVRSSTLTNKAKRNERKQKTVYTPAYFDYLSFVLLPWAPRSPAKVAHTLTHTHTLSSWLFHGSPRESIFFPDQQVNMLENIRHDELHNRRASRQC